MVGGDGIEPPTSSMSSSWCKLALSRHAGRFDCSEIGPISLLSTDSTVQPAWVATTLERTEHDYESCAPYPGVGRVRRKDRDLGSRSSGAKAASETATATALGPNAPTLPPSRAVSSRGVRRSGHSRRRVPAGTTLR